MANSLIIRPHVLSDRDEIRAEYEDGVTLQEIADSVWPAEIQEHVVMAINGDIIPKAYWPKVRPKPGAFVRGVLVFAGGGKKNVLGVIASIAVAIAAPYLGGALAASMGVTSTVGVALVTVGVALVGNMMVGALFKPPAMDVGGPGTNPEESAVYSISGQQNQATPYSPIPRVYGTHKLFPRLAATPFIDNQADSQFLYMLLDFGYGPVNVSEIMIGETPIASYKGVDYRIHPRFVAGTQLQLYPSDVAVEQVAVDMQYGVETIRTAEPQSIRIAVDFAFPQGLMKINEEKGFRANFEAPITIQVAPSGTSDWVGFNAFPARVSNGASRAALLSTTVAQTGDVEVRAHFLRKTGRDNYYYGFPVGAYQFTWTGGVTPVGGARLIFPDGAVYGISSVVGDQIYLSTALTKEYIAATAGFSNLTSKRMVVRQYPGSASGADGVVTTSARTTEPVFLTVEFDVPQGDYDVKVVRWWGDSYRGYTVMKACSFVGLRSFANRPALAPKAAHTIMELKILASDQLNGVIQNLSAICSAALPAYTSGTVPGSSYTEIETRNPAWAFLDVLIGSANPRPLASDRIDHESIQRWAIYCDTLVTIDGGSEPRQMFDHIVDYRTTIYKLLESIAGVGRATVAWRDGKIGVIMDQDQTVPVQMFTPRNSWGFNASRKYLEEPHAFRCKFNDPILGYQQGTVIVYSTGYDENTATQFEDLQLFGITRSTQAWRDGRYMMAQGLLRREECTIQTDVENLACLRGDLVWLQHDVLRVGGDSSRIASVVSPTVITQYDPLPTLPPGTYGVRIRREDGTFLGPIEATPTPPYTWTLVGGITGVAQFDLLTWGELGQETGEYLIKHIEPGPDLTATLTLVEIARAIYQSDTGPIPPYVPPANGRPDNTDPRPVTGLKITQVNKTVNRRPAADIYIEWSVPRYGNYPICHVYEVGTGVDNLIYIGDTKSNKLKMATDVDLLTSRLLSNTVRYAVQAVDWVGARSELTYVTENITLPRPRPGTITAFASNVQGLRTTLTWRDPIDGATNQGTQQIAGYEIRWSSDVNAYFDNASRVTDRVTWGTYSVSVPTRNGVYLIKAVTTTGMYSASAAKTVTAVQDLVRRDWYAKPQFSPAWAGQFIDCELVGGELRLLKDPETGLYYRTGYWISNYKQLFNQKIICRIDSHISVYGFRDDEVLAGPRWTPIANADPITEADGDQYDARLWVAGSDRHETVIADWDPLETAIPLAGSEINLDEDAWPIISGEIDAKEVYFIIELRSFDGTTTPSVWFGSAEIDFPERLETHNDVAVPAGGLRVVFDYPFVWTPNIGITLQDAQPGYYVQRTLADQYGVTLNVRNSAGTGVSGSVDLQVWGVGRVTE